MWFRALTGAAAVIAAGMLGGCASDGGALTNGLTTSSVTSEGPSVKAQAKVDPQCVALMSKIDGLRKEGTPERIEKVSTGKGASVKVKRASLARMTELDKANAEFQQRCSTLTPAEQAASAKPTAVEAMANAAAGEAKEAATDAATKAATKQVAKTATKTVTKAVAQ